MFFFPSTWFRFLTNKPARKPIRNKPQSGFRLNVEELESRLAPAIGLHHSLVDPGAQANLVGDSVQVQVATTDTVNTPNSIQATGLPSGLSLDSSGEKIVGSINTGAQNGGPYSVTVSILDSSNNVIDTESFVWTIHAVPTIAWANPADITYGDALGETQLNASTGIAGTYSYSVTSGAVLHAGNNQQLSVTFTPVDTAHYTTATKTVSLNVLPAQLTISAVNKSRTYGADNPSLTATYSGFVNGDTVESLFGLATLSTEATSASNAGSYAITISGASSDDYSFNYEAGTLLVNKANATISVTPYSETYDGSSYTATFTVTGVNNETLSGMDVIGTTHTNAGSYNGDAWTFTDVTGNYNDAAGTVDNNIGKATLTVTADPQNKTYSDANPTLTATLTGFANGEDATFLSGSADLSTTADETSPFGTYAITSAIGSLSSSNYDFNFANGTLTVDKATLTVTADNQAKYYSHANPSFTATITGFVNGEDSGVFTGAAALSTTADETSAVGAYTITAAIGSLSASNYDFTFTNGTLTIIDRPQLTLTAEVLANHQVQLTGQVSQADQLDGFTVSFYGSSYTATVDANGDYSVTVDDAELGFIYAYAHNDAGLTSEPAQAEIALAAPAITLSVDSVTANTVTISGTVTDIDAAGRTVQISGIANGTAITDANGDFTFTGYVLSGGSVSVLVTNLWGQTATDSDSVASLPAATSRIISLFTQVLPGHQVELTGRVQGDFTGDVTVTFSGAASGTTTADSNGYFTFTTSSASLGDVYASGTDEDEQSTDTAVAAIDVAAPVLTLEISDQGEDFVTLTGSVADLDLQGLTVTFGGVVSGTTATGNDGKFSITLALSEAGNITASTTNAWGKNSNLCLLQGDPGPFTSGANARGGVPTLGAGVTRATILAGITRRNPGTDAAPTLPRMPANHTFSRVGGLTAGFRRGVIPANTIMGPSGCGPCVGVIIYPINDPTLPAYAFHFGFAPSEDPVATFQREITNRVGNWAAIRGNYRAVFCGAEVSTPRPGAAAAAVAAANAQNNESARVLQAAVNGVTNTLQVTIWGYVPGPGVAVDAAGTVYWPYGPSTPIPTTYP